MRKNGDLEMPAAAKHGLHNSDDGNGHDNGAPFPQAEIHVHQALERIPACTGTARYLYLFVPQPHAIYLHGAARCRSLLLARALPATAAGNTGRARA
jgi:hypothetical protein